LGSEPLCLGEELALVFLKRRKEAAEFIAGGSGIGCCRRCRGSLGLCLRVAVSVT